MEDAGFIIGSYVITFGAIAIYALAVLGGGGGKKNKPPNEKKKQG